MGCVLLEVTLNLRWIHLWLMYVHKGEHTHAYTCIKTMDLPPMFSSEHYQHGEVCTSEKSCWHQTFNVPACLSSAVWEPKKRKAIQGMLKVTLPVLSSSYNKVVTAFSLLHASATVPKPWSHFCRKSHMKGFRMMVNCCALPGRSDSSCSCISQGRCMSRLSPTVWSTDLCRLEGWFYSKIIWHIHPSTISNQHWQVFPAIIPPQTTQTAMPTQDQLGDRSAFAEEPVGGTELEQLPPWKSPPLLERRLSFPLFPFLILLLLSSSGFCSFPIYD